MFFCLNIYIYWDFVCLLRKNSLVMESLASLLKEKGEASRVVFITGAGLSVASGIPTYRGGKDATWSNFVYKWGTREKFLKDPLEWYNTFWLATHHKKSYLTAKPNVGHRTVALLARRFKGVRVITQNIDGLHLRGKHYVPDEQLVEVHGHLDKYKCVTAGCPNEQKTLNSVPLVFSRPRVSGKKKGTKRKGEMPSEDAWTLDTPPKCEGCGEALLPQALFFDEDYESHPFYQYEKVEAWMEECCAFVFVGTSFSVGITLNAILEARRRQIPVYNFNLASDENFLSQTHRLKDENLVHSILGRCEVTLPILYQLSTSRTSSRILSLKLGTAPETGDSGKRGTGEGRVLKRRRSNESIDEGSRRSTRRPKTPPKSLCIRRTNSSPW